jgi:hypothetical protein
VYGKVNENFKHVCSVMGGRCTWILEWEMSEGNQTTQ